MTWIAFAIFAMLMEILSIETDLRQQMLQISLSWGLIPPSVARLADQSSLRDYSCRIGNEGAALAKISMLKNSFSKNAFLDALASLESKLMVIDRSVYGH